jgi:hypothetical protein
LWPVALLCWDLGLERKTENTLIYLLLRREDRRAVATALRAELAVPRTLPAGLPFRSAADWSLVVPHACCGVVSNVCCDVSALRGAVFKLSPAPLLPPNPAIACTS